ncbi:hypothetical protein Mp_5g12280 [Marchantia polymorpha subsp. ruderalis]|uniref:Zinc transporter n=2 Tax=Marchantia polymorpha TaxID=3197 RepID=A0AAF6BHJ9_MARPO|nr:hypothetical protein MARPO_0092s0078 [Marchantia polymorpha]BBN11483.1 hypothetical protein Mp_5g12280 [Marchantia polymorpha subsp. ruderalis]|eukprot:PTQ33117.1 hypothetical protein MARPO_0092s0078 [Marchantia polymorpha]
MRVPTSVEEILFAPFDSDRSLSVASVRCAIVEFKRGTFYAKWSCADVDRALVSLDVWWGFRMADIVGEQLVVDHGIRGADVSLVAMLTLLMAVVTGLGATPFFFMKVEAQYAGICNGIASGVMLAASFDLIQEGQKHGGGTWVVVGILFGSFFIFYCQKVLDKYEDVKMMELKGADARKMVLVIGIMFLHSLGEGAGVGVSYAGPQGLPQGLVVSIAIAVHNIPEGMAVCMVLTSRGVRAHHAMLWSIFTSLPQPLVAVPAFVCAQAFQKFLPLCMGFAAGCMVWMVLAEVIPESFKDASHSQVASAATLSVACMEILSTTFQDIDKFSGMQLAISAKAAILFGLGHIVGGLVLLFVLKTTRLPSLLLIGIGCGIAFVLASWPPLQFWLQGDVGFFSTMALLVAGALLFSVAGRFLLDTVSASEYKERKKAQSGLIDMRSPLRRTSLLATICMGLYVLGEGLLLGVVIAKPSTTIGHPLLAAFFHSFSGGVVVTTTIFGGTNSSGAALLGLLITGCLGSIGASCASFVPLTLVEFFENWMVAVCGCVFAAFGFSLLRQALGVDSRKIVVGASAGYIVALVCLFACRMLSPEF